MKGIADIFPTAPQVQGPQATETPKDPAAASAFGALLATAVGQEGAKQKGVQNGGAKVPAQPPTPAQPGVPGQAAQNQATAATALPPLHGELLDPLQGIVDSQHATPAGPATGETVAVIESGLEREGVVQARTIAIPGTGVGQAAHGRGAEQPSLLESGLTLLTNAQTATSAPAVTTDRAAVPIPLEAGELLPEDALESENPAVVQAALGQVAAEIARIVAPGPSAPQPLKGAVASASTGGAGIATTARAPAQSAVPSGMSGFGGAAAVPFGMPEGMLDVVPTAATPEMANAFAQAMQSANTQTSAPTQGEHAPAQAAPQGPALGQSQAALTQAPATPLAAGQPVPTPNAAMPAAGAQGTANQAAALQTQPALPQGAMPRGPMAPAQGATPQVAQTAVAPTAAAPTRVQVTMHAAEPSAAQPVAAKGAPAAASGPQTPALTQRGLAIGATPKGGSAQQTAATPTAPQPAGAQSVTTAPQPVPAQPVVTARVTTDAAVTPAATDVPAQPAAEAPAKPAPQAPAQAARPGTPQMPAAPTMQNAPVPPPVATANAPAQQAAALTASGAQASATGTEAERGDPRGRTSSTTDASGRVQGFSRGAFQALSAYGGRGHAGADHGAGESSGSGKRTGERGEREGGGLGAESKAAEAGFGQVQDQVVNVHMHQQAPEPSMPAPMQSAPAVLAANPVVDIPDVEFAGVPVPAAQQTTDASISLHHPDLGPIRLEVHREQGRVEVHAVIQNEHAEAVLRANESGIRQGVQQSGMALNALRVRREEPLQTSRQAAVRRKRETTGGSGREA